MLSTFLNTASTFCFARKISSPEEREEKRKEMEGRGSIAGRVERSSKASEFRLGTFPGEGEPLIVLVAVRTALVIFSVTLFMMVCAENDRERERAMRGKRGGGGERSGGGNGREGRGEEEEEGE